MFNFQGKWSQYLAGLSCTLGAFAFGTIFGWSSPAGPMLQAEFGYTSRDLGWIASALNIGSPIACLFIGFFMNTVGRKLAMLILVIPLLIGWSLIIWAQNFSMIFAGRLIMGLAGGACFISIPQYTSEIADKEIRGALGICFQLFLNFGILFVYVVGALVDRLFLLNVICAITPVIFAVCFIFMPESPHYLIHKNKIQEGEEALKWLRGAQCETNREIEEIKSEILKTESKISIMEFFRRCSDMRGLFITVGLVFFFQMSGINAVLFYTVEIFEAAHVDLDPNISAIILGVVQVLATLSVTFIVDRSGRRILLLVSAIAIVICLTLLGSYYYLKDIDSENVRNLQWLPLTSLSIYIIAFSTGVGPVTWVIMSEVFSYDVKAFTTAFTGFVNESLSFVILNTFELLVSGVGRGPTFWLFASITLVGVIFIFFLVPETKGKSFVEIQETLAWGFLVKNKICSS